MVAYHFERALFVVGLSGSGKSTQLRSMFRDFRLGNEGKIPTANKLRNPYMLSNERCLYVKLRSPHEANETLAPSHKNNFLDKTERNFKNSSAVRRNFASALQAGAKKQMPDIVDTVRAFVDRFNPERTRVAFINPDRRGNYLSEELQPKLIDRLRTIRSLETCSIDARDATANGLLLADFFDFT